MQVGKKREHHDNPTVLRTPYLGTTRALQSEMGICSQALHLVVSSEAKAVQLNSLHNSISQDALAIAIFYLKKVGAL
jgi:hypothetical protein